MATLPTPPNPYALELSDAGLPAEAQPSPKSYATAVALSGLVGFLGLQHFYLRRYGEGLLDVALTLAWIYSFATGAFVLGLVFLLLDFAHSLTVTIMLLTGNFKDGDGRVVCYPGQKLATRQG